MGGGWLGGGWQGGGWQGGGWQGGGWSGGGGGGFPTFATRADKPLADFPIAPDLTELYPDFPKRYWDPDLWALSLLPEFFGCSLTGGHWEGRITVPAPTAITAAEIDRMKILAVTERPER
jgi:acid phosphatase (class A)